MDNAIEYPFVTFFMTSSPEVTQVKLVFFILFAIPGSYQAQCLNTNPGMAFEAVDAGNNLGYPMYGHGFWNNRNQVIITDSQSVLRYKPQTGRAINQYYLIVLHQIPQAITQKIYRSVPVLFVCVNGH